MGAADAVMGLKSGSTQIVDLGGRALLPGFIDPHQHTVTGALVNAFLGYPNITTCLTPIPSRSRSNPSLISSSFSRWVSSASTGSFPALKSAT